MAKARFFIVFYCVSLLLSAGCTKAPATGHSGYFSIKDFARDHRKSLIGQPFVPRQVTTLNGKTDTAYIALEKMDWATILALFSATDIGDSVYAGQYQFSSFYDNTLEGQANTYEAINPRLFTRRLQFTTNPETNRIGSIYIETADETAARKRWQKLYYSPKKLLRIEENETPMLGKARNLRVEYQFEYD